MFHDGVVVKAAPLRCRLAWVLGPPGLLESLRPVETHGGPDFLFDDGVSTL